MAHFRNSSMSLTKHVNMELPEGGGGGQGILIKQGNAAKRKV